MHEFHPAYRAVPLAEGAEDRRRPGKRYSCTSSGSGARRTRPTTRISTTGGTGRITASGALRAFSRGPKREIETTVNKLRDAGLILTAKLSKDPKDTTLSYTVVAEKIGVSPFGDTLSQNGGNAVPEWGQPPVTVTGTTRPQTGTTLNEHIKTQVEVQANKPEEDANKPSPRQVMDRYNAICTSLSRCIRLTDKRAKAVRQLFAKGYTAEQLTDAFGRAQASSFCTGSNDRGWRADFDWAYERKQPGQGARG